MGPKVRAAVPFSRGKKEKKERSVYSAFIVATTLKALRRGSHSFYLQITPRLPFLRVRSPDVATTATAAADIQLQLTTHLSTPKG